MHGEEQTGQASFKEHFSLRSKYSSLMSLITYARTHAHALTYIRINTEHKRGCRSGRVAGLFQYEHMHACNGEHS